MTLLPDLRRHLRILGAGWLQSPLFWILAGAGVLRLAGILWGLPASAGWDDDGIAPRDFLVGVAQTYNPGSYFTYPPVHSILLAILTAPGWVTALARAHSLTQAGVIGEVIKVPYMTFFAVTARLVSVAMSLGTIACIARMTEIVAGRRAGLCAALACVLNAAFTYYSQVSNLEGPCLFWTAFSLLLWMRAIADHQPRRIVWAAVTAALAIATKDQAYAVFLLSIPAGLVLWFVLDPWPRHHERTVGRAVVQSAIVALFGLLLVDGAVTNPSGFAKRFAFLTGPASADFANFSNDWHGRFGLLADMGVNFSRYYPPAAALLAIIGVAFHLARTSHQPSRRAAGLLPLLAIVSFTLAFNLVVLRSEPRFLLPQSVFAAVYIGIATDGVAFAPQRLLRYAAWAALPVIAALALYRCLGIDAAFLHDPRYDAERWMAANVRPGEKIETYGLNVYLPRFPAGANVERLDFRPPRARSPLPHVTELDQPLGLVAARDPRVIIVSGFWVRVFLEPANAPTGNGVAVPGVQQTMLAQSGARDYFRALFGGALSYRLAHISAYEPGAWPPPDGYESLGQTIFIFAREPGR